MNRERYVHLAEDEDTRTVILKKKKEEKGKTCFQFYKKITPNIPSKIFHVEVKISFGKRAKVDLKG